MVSAIGLYKSLLLRLISAVGLQIKFCIYVVTQYFAVYYKWYFLHWNSGLVYINETY